MGGNYILVRDVIISPPQTEVTKLKKTHVLKFLSFYLSFSAKTQDFHSKYLFCRLGRPYHSPPLPATSPVLINLNRKFRMTGLEEDR